jgi:murein DD-endopeptidase MepM/ murein hydrolase activator NlpD
MTGEREPSRETPFPERHIVLYGHGGVRRVRLSRATQLVGVAVLAALAALLAQFLTGYLAFDRLVAAKDAEVLQAEMSIQDFRAFAVRLRLRLDAAEGELGTARADADALRGQLLTAEMRLRSVEEARDAALRARDETAAKATAEEETVAARSGQVAQLGRTVEGLRSELRQADAQRSSTMARLRQAEAELGASQALLGQTRNAAETAEKRALAATAEQDRLRRRVAELEVTPQLSTAQLRIGLSESKPAEPALAVRSDAPRRGWAEVEQLLRSAGVDVERFVARFNTVPIGQGGPFVLADPRKGKADGIAPEALQTMLGSLPLAAPLTHYQLESRFGARSDPFNHQKSFHTGLDFSAPYRSPVYNTAPGTVSYAGPRGDYGKVVEIDHGSGIVTRYAHLNRTTVAVGQRLAARQQIGLLGSTGRSSGPHVHYEILVNGTPQDPERFLNLGKTTLAAVK